jgi:zona occludens toxin
MGKTALLVQMLMGQYAGRPVFTNVRGLTLEHSKLPLIEEWTTEERNDQGTSEYQFTFPPGSVVAIDECQQFFRPRATGSKVPPYISAFETHRHRGIDFILLTQGSGLLDANIRKLVKGGLHIFLKSSYLGRYRYEKSEVINEDDKSSYSLATKRKYRLPKETFNLYKSAELHTKPPRAKLPWAAYVVVGAVAIGGFLAWKTTSRISGVVNPGETKAEGVNQDVPRLNDGRAVAVMASAVPARLVEAMTPADDANPLSAPLYAAVVPPVVAPEVVGCIASAKSCTCYSQQATPVWLPPEQCRQRAAGLYYDPYHQPKQREQEDTQIADTKAPVLKAKPDDSTPLAQNPPRAREGLGVSDSS